MNARTLGLYSSVKIWYAAEVAEVVVSPEWSLRVRDQIKTYLPVYVGLCYTP